MKIERFLSFSPLLRSHLSRKRWVSLAAFLLRFQEKISQFLEKDSLSVNLDLQRPQLPSPLPSSGGFRPPRYFHKGPQETDHKKNPEPIPYLLTATSETARARPVPGNSFLFRSLCKGKGILRQNRQGLVYLDIDNYFILSLIPYLKGHGLAQPPHFDLEGAHTPVIPAREITFRYLPSIREVGQEFSFEIQGLYSVEPTFWSEVEQVWFFKLKSAQLETLRRRYFLSEKPGGHSFHLVVAIKKRPTTARQPTPLPMMRINPSYLAA